MPTGAWVTDERWAQVSFYDTGTEVLRHDMSTHFSYLARIFSRNGSA